MRTVSIGNFLARFTDAEVAALKVSADIHVVAFFFILPYRDGPIDLDAADIIAGVNYLKTMTGPILASQVRVNAILA